MEGAANSKPEPSPTNKKKKLAELFSESFGDDQVADEQNIAGNQNIANGKLEPQRINLELPPKSTNGTPFVSGVNSVCSSERTPNKDSKLDKSARAAQCCLPSFVQSLSFNERKKRLSPGRNAGG